MSARIELAVLAFGIAMTCTIVANLLWFKLIGAVNRRRPNAEQVSYWGFTYFKLIATVDEYRRSYPKGRIHVLMYLLVALMALSMITVAVSLSFVG